MKNKNELLKGLVWFLGVAAIFGALVILKGRAEAPGVLVSDSTPMATISQSSSSDAGVGDDQVVKNAAGGYSFTMPASWYLEKNDAAGVAVYPDYDPKGAAAPACKIEISAFVAPVGEVGLNDWLTGHLHVDPTANVAEISRANIKVGSSSALAWYGDLNGVTTTLVYVPAKEKVLEIAPSSLGMGSPDADDCGLILQAFIAHLHL